MEYRRFGRTNHLSSVLVYGAAALWEATQEEADASLAQAFEAGINHIDVAWSYGVAEERLGPILARDGLPPDLFLGTKSTKRDAEGAWSDFNRSLELLGLDHVDLLQVHEISSMSDLDQVFAPGGAMEAFIRARDEGMATYLGITGHTEAAPSVHAEGLRRFDFDSVLTPVNYHLYTDVPGFADDFDALLELIVARDVGLRTIKATAHRPWLADEQKYATWYAPFDDDERITAAISWVLGTFPQITAIATAGEMTLLAKAVQAQANRMAADEAAAILASVGDYASPFSVPSR